MLSLCRDNHPIVSFRWGDAWDLADYSANERIILASLTPACYAPTHGSLATGGLPPCFSLSPQTCQPLTLVLARVDAAVSEEEAAAELALALRVGFVARPNVADSGVHAQQVGIDGGSMACPNIIADCASARSQMGRDMGSSSEACPDTTGDGPPAYSRVGGKAEA